MSSYLDQIFKKVTNLNVMNRTTTCINTCLLVPINLQTTNRFPPSNCKHSTIIQTTIDTGQNTVANTKRALNHILKQKNYAENIIAKIKASLLLQRVGS